VLFAVSDEWHQTLVRYRDAAWYDVVCGAIGSAAAGLGRARRRWRTAAPPVRAASC
jgi:VanZ family protein